MRSYSLLITVLLSVLIFAGCQSMNSPLPSEPPVPNGVVMELSPDGKVIWSSEEYSNPTTFGIDEQGNKLVSDKQSGKSFEVDKNNKIVWSSPKGDNEFIEKTEEGNYLVLNESLKPSFQEIDKNGNSIVTIEEMPSLGEIHKLKNGNYILASRVDGVVREIDKNKKVIWESKKGLFKQPYSVQLLDNGNYLVSDFDNHRVVEINKKSDIVWNTQIKLNHPIASRQLKNGSIMISDRDNNRIIIIDKNGTILNQIHNINSRNITLLKNGNVGIAGIKQ